MLILGSDTDERSSGGPFFRDINNQGTAQQELYFYMNSNHMQTEGESMLSLALDVGGKMLIMTQLQQPTVPDSRDPTPWPSPPRPLLPRATLVRQHLYVSEETVAYKLFLFLADTSFFSNLNILGYTATSGRGVVKGTASGIPSSFSNLIVVGWKNENAQCECQPSPTEDPARKLI
jgi:hypothetical protein